MCIRDRNNARANLSKNKAKLEQAGDDEKKKTSALALIQKWEMCIRDRC